MREQRATKITLNSVFNILKLIPLFTVSKSKPFQCCQLKRILSNTSATFVYCTDTVYIGKILHLFRSSVTTRHPLLQPFSKLVKNIPFSYKNSIFPTLSDNSAAHCPAQKNVPFLILCSRIGTKLTASRRPTPRCPAKKKYIFTLFVHASVQN